MSKWKEKYNPDMPSRTYDRADYEALRSSSIPAMMSGSSNKSMRFDSVEDASVFFARELDYIKAKTYDTLYPEFNALNLFPVSNEVDPGADTTTYYSYDKIGLAEIISNYATDLPRVDVKGEPVTAYVKSIGDSYGYNIQELRASRLAGKSLDARRGDAAKYAIDYKLNRIAWCGDEANKLNGVLSIGNDVPVYTPSLNAAGTSTKFLDKTPEEILRDISAWQAYTATLTKSVEKPDTLALPTEAYLHLANTPRSSQSDKTILSWILDNSPRLKNIYEVPELNDDSDMTPYAGQGVAFMFKKDENKFTFEIPLPFVQHPIQPVKLEFEIPCEARTAGVIIYYPLSMLVIPGI